VTMLALNRLGGRDGRRWSSSLPAMPVSREIVERADGVPLFVEELTKAVLERADRDHQVAAVLAASPSPELAIPAALHASLIARLDRLGPVAQRPGTELRSGLDRLAEAGLLFCRGVPPQSSYLFKHALVPDAAYGTLLRARRQELHARVAAMLEQRFADLVERQPELLAHHLTAAGDTQRAVDQWLKAGRRAADHSAHREAIGHFDRGLLALPALPKDRRDGREIELQLVRGLSLFTTEGFRSAGAAQAYTRARELAEGFPPAVCSGVRSLAIGQRPRQDARLPQIVGPAAATNRGQGGRRFAPASTSQCVADV